MRRVGFVGPAIHSRRGALLVAVLVLLAQQAGASGETVADVERCLRANFPKATSVQRVRFQTRDRTGEGREIEGRVWWRRFPDGRSRVLYRVLSPADLRGSAVLAIQRGDGGSDLFSYLPELRKVRRISSQSLQGSLFGSDFTYEDFQYLQGLREQKEVEIEPGASHDGDWTLSSTPDASSGSAYTRVVLTVDKKTCLPVRTEFYEAGDRLRKVMTLDPEQVFEQDGARIPMHVEMTDRLEESRTELDVLEVEVGRKVPRRVFDMKALERAPSE